MCILCVSMYIYSKFKKRIRKIFFPFTINHEWWALKRHFSSLAFRSVCKQRGGGQRSRLCFSLSYWWIDCEGGVALCACQLTKAAVLHHERCLSTGPGPVAAARSADHECGQGWGAALASSLCWTTALAALMDSRQDNSRRHVWLWPLADTGSDVFASFLLVRYFAPPAGLANRTLEWLGRIDLKVTWCASVWGSWLTAVRTREHYNI